MRRIVIVLSIVVATAVLSYAAMIGLFEVSGEVVAVRTVDAKGANYDSRLWIVDVDGHAYLRTGNAKSRWLANLRTHPEVSVTRAGLSREFVATPVDDPDIRAAVNAATAAKYGIAESFLRMAMLDPAHTIPVRLDPLTE